MPAKTDTDKAHDALVKVLSVRGVNYYILANKLWNGPEWLTEQLWTFFLAYIKIAEIRAEHPPIDMSPAQVEHAKKLAKIHKGLTGI